MAAVKGLTTYPLGPDCAAAIIFSFSLRRSPSEREALQALRHYEYSSATPNPSILGIFQSVITKSYAELCNLANASAIHLLLLLRS